MQYGTDRYPQSSDGHGSLKDIQVLINQFPHVISSEIIKHPAVRSSEIRWVSPRADDAFSEYRDDGFLKKIGITSLHFPLSKFWPKRGPQWDALGVGDKRELFLIEAKANISELASPGTKAKGKSLQLLQKSLEATKSYLKVSKKVDWCGNFYQYTNRLAHLYFLRILNRIPAYLIFVYFIGDDTVAGPKTVDEWDSALTVMKRCLGLGKHYLDKYIIDIFINVEQIGL